MRKSISLSKFLIIILIPLLLVVMLVVIIDPFFHYHKPISGMSYVLSDERYQNDGIVKHFSYDAIISGSSETQNFKTSDFDRLFGTKTIKVSFAAGSFKEVDSLMRTALNTNPDIKCIFRSFDLNLLNVDKDFMSYSDYPNYLYDKNIFNDYAYVFNKKVLLESMNNMLRTVKKVPPTSFDEYASFYGKHSFSKEDVMSTFERSEFFDGDMLSLSLEDANCIQANVGQNILETARNYPDVTFYYFIPPYSIVYWDALIRTRQFDQVFESLEIALCEMLNQDNIKIYAFYDRMDIVANLDNYMDTLHYSDKISSDILNYISNDEGRITKDNYVEYLEAVKREYLEYDYDSLFE